MKTNEPNGGYTQVRASEALVIEAAKSWQRLQQAKEFFFADLEEQMKENHRRFLDMLMLEERQRFLQAHPYQRHEQRVDQANGFYGRSLTTRLGVLELQVPRSRSGAFRPQVLPRYKRCEAVVDEALRKVFLCGVSTRQAGPALAGLLDEAVSAATVSTVAKVLDESVAKWHRRALSDHYPYLILDGVSVRLRLVGKVQRRVVLCVYGITKEGKGELIDFSSSKERKPGELEEFARGVVEARFTRRSSQTHRHRWQPRTGQSVERSVAARGAPALLGAQTAQLAKPAQSLAAPLPARSQTHLPSAESTGSDRPL